MNLSDMNFKNPPELTAATHPSDLAMELIAAQMPPPDPAEKWTAVLMHDGGLVHAGSYHECWKLRELIRQCGGQVSMFTNMESEQ